MLHDMLMIIAIYGIICLSDCLSDCFTAIGLKPSSLFVSVFIAQDTLQILFSFMVFMRQKCDKALNVAGVGRIAGPGKVDMQTRQSNTGAEWCKFQEHRKDYQTLSNIIKDYQRWSKIVERFSLHVLHVLHCITSLWSTFGATTIKAETWQAIVVSPSSVFSFLFFLYNLQTYRYDPLCMYVSLYVIVDDHILAGPRR